jgi:hypothetical protein
LLSRVDPPVPSLRTWPRDDHLDKIDNIALAMGAILHAALARLIDAAGPSAEYFRNQFDGSRVEMRSNTARLCGPAGKPGNARPCVASEGPITPKIRRYRIVC